MDTMLAMPPPWQASPAADGDLPQHWPLAGDPRTWHRLTYAAVLMAWHRDPDVMCDLVATLLDIHLRRCRQPPERTLDELHLMIALELEQMGGEPE